MPAEWFNYHHLYYFYTVARLGTISAACSELRLRQPTVSTQLRNFEDALGVALFDRRGKRLTLTEVGQVVYRYAEQIFALGRELGDIVRGQEISGAPELTVGIADVIPKLVAHRIIAPVLSYPGGVALSCREDHPDQLLSELSIHRLDLVLSDAPIPSGFSLRGYSHRIATSGVAFFAGRDAAPKLRRSFPNVLATQTVHLPALDSVLGRQLHQWFESIGIRPKSIVRFEDSALMKMFAVSAGGVFPAPTMIAADVKKQFGVAEIGQAHGVEENYYLISPERKIRNPVVQFLIERARG